MSILFQKKTYNTIGLQERISLKPNLYVQLQIDASDDAEYDILSTINPSATAKLLQQPQVKGLKGMQAVYTDSPEAQFALNIVSLGSSGEIILGYQILNSINT